MSGRKRLNWPQAALNLAYSIAQDRSEDPYVQVGAAAVKFDQSILLGYNGAPAGVEIDWTNRDERRKRVLHAEANVLNFCKPKEVKLLVCTHLPCPECLKTIAQKGIGEVYYDQVLDGYDNELSFTLAREFGIDLRKIEREKDVES